MPFENKNDLYTYTTTFNIYSEKGLDDFWSYFIFRLNLEKSEGTYDRFARLYNFLSDNKKLLSPVHYINISLKESCEEYVLFIETTIDSMINKFIKRLKILNFPYTYENEVLSYSIDKKSSQKPLETSKKIVDYSVYNFIDQDDLDEMNACIGKMRDGNYNRVYFEEISTYQNALSKYAGILRLYPQLNTINNYFAEIAMILSLYSDECIELGVEFKTMLQSFVNNIWYWQESLFVTGGEELHFMDDSFKADLSQIKMMLNLYDELIEEESQCQLDDIFDF